MHGLIVGPTLNPSFFLSSITRFIKKLFPVRYFPTTDTTPNLEVCYDKYSSASLFKTKPFPSTKLMKGIA